MLITSMILGITNNFNKIYSLYKLLDRVLQEFRYHQYKAVDKVIKETEFYLYLKKLNTKMNKCHPQ